MKCKKCGAGVDDIMLHRTAPKGVSPADWMCMPCIKSDEPELAKNIMDDYKSEPIIGDLNKIFYGKELI